MNNKQQISSQLTLAQFIAVLVWFLITVVQWSNNPKNSPGLAIPLIVRGIEAISVFVVSSGMIFIINKINYRVKAFIARAFILIGIYLFALIANILSLALRRLLSYEPPIIDGYFFIQSLHFYIPLLLVFVVYYLVKNRIDLQTEREDKLKAEGLAQQAKWMMLRYQVNPHFLFNALNSIRALIGHDNEKAREIVTEMSEYFRYSLSIEKKPLVKINDELSAVDNYLEIQAIRYPERLIVTKNISEETLDCIVPVFTVQTLIENAIKYGLKTHNGIVEICIDVLLENGKLKIQITNKGKLINPEGELNKTEGTNTGIKNLRQRLYFLDNNYDFQLFEKNGSVYAVVLLSS